MGTYAFRPNVIDPHVVQIRPVVPRTPQGCEECLQLGTPGCTCGSA